MNAQVKPRYQQLKELIVSQISSGKLRPRDRVPSEHELVDSTGVSRMTANRALRELNDEGIVDRIAGVGTFVADLKGAFHVLEVRDISDEVCLRGHEYSARVLQLDRQCASAEIAELLRLAEGDKIDHVRLIHREDGVPIQMEDRYVSPNFAPDFLLQDFSVATPGGYLSTVVPLQEAEHVVTATLPTSSVSRQLQMKKHEPCLLVTRRTWSDGKPVSFARLFHPGTRFELSGHYAPPGMQERCSQKPNISELRNIDK